ncbi:ATP-binding cassette sub-family A member 13-like [Mixophyes fleayi]|uniref:ATP-binding cassette sub-family A member 13-like n=1 Tax=Mixophyes fleayi TaxID=3061075 RepID=UPI003F4E3997
MHNILKWTFLIFPQFCLGHGLMELAFRQVKFDLSKSFGTDSYISPFELDFLGWVFMAMAIQGSIFLLLRLGLNGQSFERQRNEAPLPHDGLDDMDVELERRRLLGRKTAKDRLLMYNLRKCYQTVKNKNVIAVRDICLGIQGGECFGLLGLNGAGKSTIFKILVGEINPTCGRVVIKTSKGHEMNMFSAYAEDVVIGYCPQKDALDNLLTGWEHLYYYCKLRGISEKHIHKVSSGLCSRLGLDDHIDKLVGTYSGGTKRKLSAAIALIGRPQILLLDEPSSGMDPCSKRQLWKAIKNEVYEGCAAVLTSHSMEECEALCTRLAIMVNGSFKCIGSPQHIKNRFGDGYSVIVQLNKDSVSAYAVSDSFKHHFPGACLKGQHLSTLEYHVAQQADCLGDLFYVLDTMKKEHLIESYSITQTSLEQVFIQFAAQQEEHFTPIMTSSMDDLRQQLPA